MSKNSVHGNLAALVNWLPTLGRNKKNSSFKKNNTEIFVEIKK